MLNCTKQNIEVKVLKDITPEQAVAMVSKGDVFFVLPGNKLSNVTKDILHLGGITVLSQVTPETFNQITNRINAD